MLFRRLLLYNYYLLFILNILIAEQVMVLRFLSSTNLLALKKSSNGQKRT